MDNNKTIVIYTKENKKYHAFITGMNIYVANSTTLVECEERVKSSIERKVNPSTLEVTAKEIKEYFKNGDIETIENIVKLEIIEV